MERLPLNLHIIMHPPLEHKECIYINCSVSASSTFNIKNLALAQAQTDGIIKSNNNYSMNPNQKSNIGLCDTHKNVSKYIEFILEKRQDRLNTKTI